MLYLDLGIWPFLTGSGSKSGSSTLPILSFLFSNIELAILFRQKTTLKAYNQCCRNRSWSRSTDIGRFGWKWKQKQLKGITSASCFRCHVSVLRLTLKKLCYIYWDCGKICCGLNLKGCFENHFVKVCQIFWTHNIFFDHYIFSSSLKAWQVKQCRARSGSGLQFFQEAEAKKHCFHITA